jgi:hypothetical protein
MLSSCRCCRCFFVLALRDSFSMSGAKVLDCGELLEVGGSGGIAASLVGFELL